MYEPGIRCFTKLHGKIEAKIQTRIALVLTARIREHSFMYAAFSIVLLFTLLDCVTNETSETISGSAECYAGLSVRFQSSAACM